jgi:hypothetical protein
VKVIGVVPVQVPFVVVRVWPDWGVPDTVGREATAGGVAVTNAVGAEGALALPPLFVALTTTMSVCPTSALAAVYVVAVAPEMLLQFAPVESQRCHW